MSGPEARRALARAREQLYTGRTRSLDFAIRLADSVIHRCGVPRYVWEGHFVKASAYQAKGDNKAAEQAARAGVDTILAAQAGPLSDAALTALKILLPVYVESAAASGERQEMLARLKTWRTALSGHFGTAAAQGELDPVDAEFALLEQMAEQQMAARKPESLVQKAVQHYMDLFNTRDTAGLSALLAPRSELAGRVLKLGAAGLVSPTADRLFLGSAIRVDISAAGAAAGSAAVATCDLIAVSPAGWSRLVPAVQFTLIQAGTDEWRIRDIAGLP